MDKKEGTIEKDESYIAFLDELERRKVLIHPRFFDAQLGSAVGAIDYVSGSGD